MGMSLSSLLHALPQNHLFVSILSEARLYFLIFNTSLRSPKSSEFQSWVESHCSLRCTLDRFNVRRLRWTMFITWKIFPSLHVRCFCKMFRFLSCIILHGRCFCKMLRFLSCVDLSAFSCWSPEKVILGTQTFRRFRRRY